MEGSATKKGSKDKMEAWNRLPIGDRVEKIGSSVQKVKDEPYAKEDYVCKSKFSIGDPVVVCCKGYYYHAVIQNEADPYDCPDLKKKVPCYNVKYPGWKNEKVNPDDTIVAEYDLVGTTRHTVAHELLYAHYWNKFKMQEMNKASAKKVSKISTKGMFELPEKTLAKLEEKWVEQIRKENPESKLTFAQWVGVE